MNLRSLLVIGFLFSLVSPLCAQEVRSVDLKKENFYESIWAITNRLENKDARKLTQLRSINRSYEAIQQAKAMIRQSPDYAEVEKRLRDALRFYPDNLVATIFLGAILEDQGKVAEAGYFYQLFFQKSPFPNEIDRGFITPEEIDRIQNHLKRWFAANDLEEPEIEVPLSHKFRRGLNRLHVFPDESLLGLILTLVTFGGFAFLLLYNAINRYEVHLFKHPISRFLIKFYYVIVTTYFVWVAHLYLGLQPFIGKSHVRQTLSILIGGTVLIFILEISSLWKQKNELKKHPTMMSCPFCKKGIMKISLECEHCKKQIPS